MQEQTFINYRNYLWFWIMLFVVLLLGLWYYLDVPAGGRSGSSYFGYTSGTLAALAILYLMWFGIRKRSYYAYKFSLKSWLAVHIWLGLSLLIIVPMHAAFDFGCNMHTMAYVFLALVVFSGIAGTYFYRFLPSETVSNRGAGALKSQFDEYDLISNQINKMAVGKSNEFATLIKLLNIDFHPSIQNAVFGKKIKELDQKLAVDTLANVPDSERPDAIKEISLLSKKRQLAANIRKEIMVRIKLKIWLYAHIPLSLGLVVLVVLHIFSIFYFR